MTSKLFRAANTFEWEIVQQIDGIVLYICICVQVDVHFFQYIHVYASRGTNVSIYTRMCVCVHLCFLTVKLEKLLLKNVKLVSLLLTHDSGRFALLLLLDIVAVVVGMVLGISLQTAILQVIHLQHLVCMYVYVRLYVMSYRHRTWQPLGSWPHCMVGFLTLRWVFNCQRNRLIKRKNYVIVMVLLQCSHIYRNMYMNVRGFPIFFFFFFE